MPPIPPAATYPTQGSHYDWPLSPPSPMNSIDLERTARLDPSTSPPSPLTHQPFYAMAPATNTFTPSRPSNPCLTKTNPGAPRPSAAPSLVPRAPIPRRDFKLASLLAMIYTLTLLTSFIILAVFWALSTPLHHAGLGVAVGVVGMGMVLWCLIWVCLQRCWPWGRWYKDRSGVGAGTRTAAVMEDEAAGVGAGNGRGGGVGRHLGNGSLRRH